MQISNILGVCSLACWLFVFVPQVYKNYSAKDASSLSLDFVFLWLLGDTLNLVGTILCGLQRSTLVLGCYFFLADSLLLSQIFLYQDSELSLPLLDAPRAKSYPKKRVTFALFALIFFILPLYVLFPLNEMGMIFGWASSILF
ncbi:putative vacuolar membrane transporter for cationic amino acids [Entomophthora muscae]|uniref:Vacuolar membrane transporter for cationic amino acids n=1 Tax=Entomophthora muscae TaxID=34485 RepID=A0ACC2UTY1_9FUNG|nr:putative vacuolar membrane transporter for cationic amino acids [Entomophthora muscae]